ncbi:hypothetical protein OH146_11035 [Salinibacterium sp. SYSU T00001]|uniref:hypothetical protein n=1 Tax=Homoserinimonas sedimenticola TaxID=2986805 RepID=UPI0022355B1E|nr:hypothetical protein [Salinibacterium sedimenticola]MCW4386306.1 hypothetical protein [Salinibacterium sedimenticola]
MSLATDYPSAVSARADFKSVLDAASRGRAVTISRADRRFAVVDAVDLQQTLASTMAANTQVAFEDGVWVGAIPGLPIAAEGRDLDDLVAELVQALREYAEDWDARLHTFRNHSHNRALVQLVHLSTDEQLAQWLSGE